MTYKSIRIACDIMEYAENRQIEEYFLIEMGDRWVSGEAEQIRDDHPEIASVREGLESKYSHSELDAAVLAFKPLPHACDFRVIVPDLLGLAADPAGAHMF